MTLELILFCSIFGLMIIASYTLGLRNGQKLAKKQEITVPNINPVKTIKEIKETKETKENERERMAYDIMMSNIDNYDGSSLGQIDIP